MTALLPILTLMAALCTNVCSTEKYTKHSIVLILRLVYFSAEQTLVHSAAMRVKTGKSAVMPEFCGIECGGSAMWLPLWWFYLPLIFCGRPDCNTTMLKKHLHYERVFED